MAQFADIIEKVEKKVRKKKTQKESTSLVRAWSNRFEHVSTTTVYDAAS